MSNFKRPFSKIKDISDRRRLPRLGKIRLGIKAVSRKTGKEYPREVDYFVVDSAVERVYGPTPKELDVMFPLNEIEAVFPQRLVWYGQGRGAKCIGDGERANRVVDNGDIHEIECPCEKLGKECQRRAHLMVILPKVSLGGVYQIDLGSYHSIVDINSGLDYIQALVGRFSMVPLKLKRVPRETHGSGRKEIHYPLQIVFEGDMNFLNALRESTGRILNQIDYVLPAPIEENPAMDAGAIVIEDEEPGKEMIDQPSPEDSQPQPEDSQPQPEDSQPQPEDSQPPLRPTDNSPSDSQKLTTEQLRLAGLMPNEVAEELGGTVIDIDKLNALKKELAKFESQSDVIYWMSSPRVKAVKEKMSEDERLLLMEAVNHKIKEILKSKKGAK